MSEQPALTIQSLVKSYGTVRALRGVDLTVNSGEIFGFLGPNGAGKTTTIRCLLDLIRPDSGTIRVLGHDPQAEPVAVRQKTGYLPGELNLEANLTAERALHYYADLRGNHLDWAFARDLARRLDLDLRTPIKNMSKGNKQKVGVVQALMNRPALLLMDEPTSGLDPLMQQEVYRMLQEARAAGATVFFSSHIISEVEAIAERVAIIRDGQIADVVDPRRLIDMAVRRVRVRFAEPVAATAFGPIPGVTVVDQMDGQLIFQVEGEMDRLVKALAIFPVVDLATERPSLEEIFLTLYRGEARPQPQ